MEIQIGLRGPRCKRATGRMIVIFTVRCVLFQFSYHAGIRQHKAGRNRWWCHDELAKQNHSPRHLRGGEEL